MFLEYHSEDKMEGWWGGGGGGGGGVGDWREHGGGVGQEHGGVGVGKGVMGWSMKK